MSKGRLVDLRLVSVAAFSNGDQSDPNKGKTVERRNRVEGEGEGRKAGGGEEEATAY